MKKIISLLAVIALMPLAFSCKKSGLKDLEYQGLSSFDWLQANVKKKGGEGVMWFQVFDQVKDKNIINSYKNDAKEKFGKYPAKIFENKWIWIMVNDRIEIRLLADDKSKEYQNTQRLKDFLSAFDLAGMEKITGPMLKGKDLEKYIPRLGDK